VLVLTLGVGSYFAVGTAEARSCPSADVDFSDFDPTVYFGKNLVYVGNMYQNHVDLYVWMGNSYHFCGRIYCDRDQP